MKNFLKFAAVAVSGLLPFIAGAISAGSGGAFNIVIGVLVMAEAVAGIALGFRYVKKKADTEKAEG